MRVRIWGCRGSVPTPGPQTVRCGGNTSCIEISLDDGTVFVLDAGTGIRELGNQLAENGVKHVHLMLTHLHLDHLEGLRFFAPLFDPESTIDLWGPRSPVVTLKERIRRSFSPPLFPIDLMDTPGRVNFHELPKTQWRIGEARLIASLIVHPGPTVGYRIEADGSSVAYIPDHEPALTGDFARRSRDWISGGSIAEDVDLLLHDAQYFEEEYDGRLGWGHSSVDSAMAYADAVGARRVVLFHHDPTHSDETMERLEAEARSLGSNTHDPPIVAREGMVLELPSR
ncbi:MAG: MBL fold metallo-hydrolase [Actinobacteria bacterium]|jgi:phosphoribosyl 1,2-cyclic phosphodiesterase|nr:MAG: MBL fold metallo-hydrolase [Actinomycetota bacterium]